MNKSSTQETVSQMFNTISSYYDRVNRILSFGLDKKWRSFLCSKLPQGERLHLLDLATGTCDQLIEAFKTHPTSSALGIDIAKDMLLLGEKKIKKLKAEERIKLQVASALAIPVQENTFDAAMISFGIRNVGNPLQCLKEMRRTLKPKGVALILEFSLPKNRFIRFFHLLYLRTLLPFLGGFFSGAKPAYVYLNKTIESFPYGQAFSTLMKEAGFSEISIYPLTFGVVSVYKGIK